MSEFKTEKGVVRAFYDALDKASAAESPDVVAAFSGKDFLWRGFHPFNEMTDPARVGQEFWASLKTSLTRLTHRMDLFFAGHNSLDAGGVWVASMGHYMGLFDKEWLGIRPTGRIAMLRYAAFHLVENGKISQTAMYFDIPHLMAQAGQYPFPPSTGIHMIQPGPATHDGLLFEDAPKEQGEQTLATINAMINDLGTWQLGLPLEEELARTWHDEMVWWGPTGIGASYTIERYAKQHSGPFRAAFSERSGTGHICRMAEGNFGGFFGWPNFTATLSGDFMGMPATGKRGEFRVIDFYRADQGKLVENWIFIDLLHFWKQQGIDVLERHAKI